MFLQHPDDLLFGKSILRMSISLEGTDSTQNRGHLRGAGHAEPIAPALPQARATSRRAALTVAAMAGSQKRQAGFCVSVFFNRTAPTLPTWWPKQTSRARHDHPSA